MATRSVPEPRDSGFSRPKHTQYAALCWRRVGTRLEVLLITSRDTGRWIIPKGWPISGLSPEASAAREAFEEAGVLGKASDHCIGLYAYDKVLAPAKGAAASLPCIVAVYPLQVKTLRDRFPESSERQRKWFSAKKAARKVAEQDLQSLLADLERLLVEANLPVGPIVSATRARTRKPAAA